MSFSSEILDLQRFWNSQLITAEKWTQQNSKIHPGEAGGYGVTNGTLHAYLKPTRKDGPDAPRAAFEKIAADLAGELNLCVPPVILYDKPTKSQKEERRCALSLICFPKIYTLHQLNVMWSRFDSDVQSSIAISIAESSGMIAFDYYVDQVDRKNPSNILYGYSASFEQGTVMFIDFAWSMNYKYRWANGGWKNMNQLVLPPLYSSYVDNSRIQQVASDIESLPDVTIIKVVERIDQSWLMKALRKDLIEGLLQRRKIVAEHVRATFNVTAKEKQ